MPKSKQQIIDEITAHIQKRGGAAGDWCVGLSRDRDARDRLFNDHHVREHGDPWIHRRASSQEEAREIESFLVSRLAIHSQADADTDLANTVYAYRRASHTTP